MPEARPRLVKAHSTSDAAAFRLRLQVGGCCCFGRAGCRRDLVAAAGGGAAGPSGLPPGAHRRGDAFVYLLRGAAGQGAHQLADIDARRNAGARAGVRLDEQTAARQALLGSQSELKLGPRPALYQQLVRAARRRAGASPSTRPSPASMRISLARPRPEQPYRRAGTRGARTRSTWSTDRLRKLDRAGRSRRRRRRARGITRSDGGRGRRGLDWRAAPPTGAEQGADRRDRGQVIVTRNDSRRRRRRRPRR